MDKKIIALSILAALSSSAQADDVEFKFGGYVKTDVMVSDYSNGAPSSGHISRQFYVPGTIYGSPGEGKQVIDFQARESRFNFKTLADVDGHKVTAFIELDFMTHADGNERVSNSYSPRLRHAFVSYDNWLVGQTWTTFQNPSALPENLDFVGAAEGTPFVRQAQIRYTNGGLQLALETPETTVTPYTGGSRIVSGTGIVPDVVARYNLKTDSGAKFTAAALLRQLNLDNANYDDTAFGYGVSVTGVVPVGDDDIKFAATYGDGMGRYMALNFVNAAVLDATGQMETISSVGGYVSYRHWWNDKWRSSITASGFKADNDVMLTGDQVNEESYSGYINLLYSPIKPLTVGVEYMHAENTKVNDDKGKLDRVMFSVKYVL
ncbi:porin [Shewanella sp. WXL01]|uniref:DcaP family trimeric outer membrane transporter n=1 Tax=Shewanella sp. WXL01 TaxID=2709721 RepID=UPI00143826A8|nr:DcaP family trimeric outer membrane transporter [Shewanella sp. WXL01]NKF48983.1 porin [Shewanella sp. WXL01]